mmetsp:Transcript_20715/g.27943  ORF Transcript_20715/g.27943 Transcript_20715/m.27943 type:complete len:85 (-) Transcript_20715:36-290(-)
MCRVANWRSGSLMPARSLALPSVGASAGRPYKKKHGCHESTAEDCEVMHAWDPFHCTQSGVCWGRMKAASAHCGAATTVPLSHR